MKGFRKVARPTTAGCARVREGRPGPPLISAGRCPYNSSRFTGARIAMIETLPEFLLHWTERTPTAIFIGEPDRDRAYAYDQVAGQVARLRAVFRRLGVARGDRVAIVAENSCVWVAAYLGAIAHGAVAVPLNTRHVTGDFDRVLDGFEPAAIVGDPSEVGQSPRKRRERDARSRTLRDIRHGDHLSPR